MTGRSVRHSTIVLERTYAASPKRVFAAWSNPEALKRWGNPGEGWAVSLDRFDFRVGGGETSSFGPADGSEVFVNETRYLDIVPDARIVSAGSMTTAGNRIFAGMLTVELTPDSKGCRLVLTEQGAFLDGHDVPENHEAGWGAMLDNLGEEVERRNAA
jgi:uncharacterized protein YndB with AHSA1/START domain